MITPISDETLLFATLCKKYGAKGLTVRCVGSVRNLIEIASKILGSSFLDDIFDKGQGEIRGDMIFTINGRNIKT